MYVALLMKSGVRVIKMNNQYENTNQIKCQTLINLNYAICGRCNQNKGQAEPNLKKMHRQHKDNRFDF